MICDVHAHYTPRNFSEFMVTGFASPVICRSSVEWPVTRSRIHRRTSKVVQTDGRGGGREAGIVAEPSALSAKRGEGRQSRSRC